MCGLQRDRRVAKTRTVAKLQSTQCHTKQQQQVPATASISRRQRCNKQTTWHCNGWYFAKIDATAANSAVLLDDEWLPRQTHSPACPGSSCKFLQAHLLIVCACSWCVHCVNGCCTRQRHNCCQQRGCQPVNECDLLWELHNSTARQHMAGSNGGN
jgi:hypothetical protein